MNQILEKINNAAIRFLTPLTPEETYKAIINEGVRLVNAEHGSVYLERNGGLEQVYTTWPQTQKISIRKKGFTYTAYKTRKAAVLNIDDLEKVHPSLKSNGVRATILIPLSYLQKSVGVLSIDAPENQQFTENELGVLKVFGTMATLAIRKSELYNETKRALETRDLFISIASHELRTPLTALNGYIQLLEGRLAKSDTVEGKWMKELSVESKRLTNLIKELLEVNRIKQGQLQFNLIECNLENVAKTAINRITLIEPNRKFIFTNKTPRIPADLIGDCDKILQVLSSLFNNAMKFSDKNSPIEVELKSTKKLLFLQVIDHGEGMESEDIGKIFEGFYKARDNHKPGMGIGLLLAKHIIEYHHGSITISSQVKKGTTVSITLPRANL